MSDERHGLTSLSRAQISAISISGKGNRFVELRQTKFRHRFFVVTQVNSPGLKELSAQCSLFVLFGAKLYIIIIIYLLPVKKRYKRRSITKKEKTHTKNKLQHITHNRTNYKDEKQKLNYTLHCRYIRNFTF